jgi:hypothetical protein
LLKTSIGKRGPKVVGIKSLNVEDATHRLDIELRWACGIEVYFYADIIVEAVIEKSQQ